MTEKFLSPETALKLMEQAGNAYRPRQIIELKEEIASETRAAELRSSITGTIDMERVKKIVSLKLQLDGLYCSWAKDEIS